MTTDDETHLQEILTRAADGGPVAAPDPVVLAQVRERGVRRRRTKVGVAAGCGAAVVVLLTGAALARRDPGSDTTAAGPTATARAGASTAPTTAAGPAATVPDLTAPAGPGPTEPPTPPTASPPATTVPVTTTWLVPETTVAPTTEPDPTGPTGPDPTDPTTAPGVLDCGTQYLASGWPTTPAPSRLMAECIVAAFETGRPATYAERAQTDGEGGHIMVTRFDVTAVRVVVVTVDATAAQPPGGVTTRTCHGLTLDSLLPTASACT